MKSFKLSKNLNIKIVFILTFISMIASFLIWRFSEVSDMYLLAIPFLCSLLFIGNFVSITQYTLNKDVLLSDRVVSQTFGTLLYFLLYTFVSVPSWVDPEGWQVRLGSLFIIFIFFCQILIIVSIHFIIRFVEYMMNTSIKR